MTELERKCLRQNATELRRVAKIMSSLQTATNGCLNNGLLTMPDRIAVKGHIVELQERLAEVINTMESLKIVIAQPLKNGTNQ
jgi:hypothetical protein